MTTPRIGWYGLGSMGLPMATNLQRYLSNTQQPSLTYYNRTISSGDALQELGAIPATSLPDLVTKCDVIFTMLANDKVLTESIQSITASNNTSLSHKTFIDCSTVHPGTTERVSKTLSGLGATFLSAPVFGGPAIAATGQLVFAIGGPRPGSEDIKRYIEGVMGRRVIECGVEARNAALLKIGGNIITLNLMEAVGEAQVFAERTGLGTGAMEELIAESFGGVAGGYSKRLTSGIYAPPLNTRPGFGISLAIKDAEHALSLATEAQVQLPGLEIAHNNMRASRDYAGECLDSSSMYGKLRIGAGLPFWNETSRQG
ncbi:NAD binding domain of 6-phosphogluconate dehydrogenase-domain-containing protein [Aspergillus cavernicola]|uniref:NAD binding domain of 6-phosphogluconate dehydrogenase-domain-containing protein n=1 Tax=Aspergillus cavernicola TaxID=176166 RepID=A0ABR4J2S7_9EURO